MENGPAWDDLRVLLEVGRRRSLLHAGRALGLSASTVARRLDQLERAVGQRLVHRTTVGTSLEPAGERLVIVAEAFAAQLAAERRDQVGPLAGSVRVSINESFARPVARVLAGWRRLHPETRIELIAEARVADLARREADLGLRTARTTGRALIEKHLATFRFGLWAAPAYLARRLRDGHLAADDLARHDFVGHEGPARHSAQARWLVAHGAHRFPFRSNSDAAMLVAAVEGQGLCITVDAFAREVPGLVRVACDLPMPTVSVYLAMHRALRQVPAVRAVAQTLEAAVREVARLPG